MIEFQYIENDRYESNIVVVKVIMIILWFKKWVDIMMEGKILIVNTWNLLYKYLFYNTLWSVKIRKYDQ